MSAYVVVHIAPRVAGVSRASRQSSAVQELQRAIVAYNGVLLSVEPDSGEDARIATVGVPDMARANGLAIALRDIDGIETAYAKPGEELP